MLISFLQESCEGSCGASAFTRHHQRALHDRGAPAQREEIRLVVLLYAFPSILSRSLHRNTVLLFKRRGETIELKNEQISLFQSSFVSNRI